MDWRVTFGVVFLLMLLCVAAYTIYRTYKAVIEHNSKESELRHAAQTNIRMRRLTAMVLRNTHSFFWKREDGVFEVSKAFREYMGWDGDPETFGALFEIEPLYMQKLRDFFSIKEPGRYMLEVYGRPKGKTPHWYELRMQVEQEEGKVVQSGITIMIDDRKAREAMELETHRMLLNAKESESFISNVNHEIRTPLNAIVGLSQIFTDPEIELTEEEVIYFAKEIDRNNTLLMKMINDMLTVTLMDNSNVGFSFEDVPMSEFTGIMRRVSREESIRARGTRVEIIEGPAATVRIDSTQMEHVLRDLVDNASKFSQNGSKVFLSWKLVENDVLITVKDEGMGIAPMYQKLIFHRFYKIDPFTPGTGLGLALARMIMEKMHGTIGVDSKKGLGSTFWVRLKNIGGGGAAIGGAAIGGAAEERKEVSRG